MKERVYINGALVDPAKPLPKVSEVNSLVIVDGASVPMEISGRRMVRKTLLVLRSKKLRSSRGGAS